MNTIRTTSDKPIQLSIHPIDANGKLLTLWAKEGPMDWWHNSGAISLVQDYNVGGLICEVRSLQPTRFVSAVIRYSCDVAIDATKPTELVRVSGETEVVFAPAGMVAGLTALAS